MESFRRNTRFIKETNGYFRLQSLTSIEELMDLWMNGTSGGRVTMFSITFSTLFSIIL